MLVVGQGIGEGGDMSEREISRGAIGWISFAAIMLIVSGGFSILQGLGWLINANRFPGTDSVFSGNVKTWGWVQLILGVLLLLSGLALFSGNVLARSVGVIAALVSMLSSFSSLEFRPVWGICVIAIDIAIIWALTAHGRDIQEDERRGSM
jgi:hypothetical protein